MLWLDVSWLLPTNVPSGQLHQIVWWPKKTDAAWRFRESLKCGVKAVIFHLPQETSHDVLVCDGCFAPLQLSFRKCFGIFCQYHTLLRSLMMVLFLFFCWISAILNMFFRKLWEKAPNNSYQKYPGELFAYFPLRLCTACTITPIISIRKWVGTHPQWIMISMVHVMVQLKCLSSLIFSYRVTKHSHQTKQSEKQDTQCHNNQGGGSKFGGWEGLHTNSTDFEKQK